MRRDDRDSIHDDRDRPRKSDSTVLVVVLAVAGALVLACGGLGALAFLGLRAVSVPAVQPALQVEEEKQFTRDEFKKLVLGKTPEETVEAVGRPDRTGGADDPHWMYEGRTFDTVTGKVDGVVIIWFEKGRASRMTF